MNNFAIIFNKIVNSNSYSFKAEKNEFIFDF